MSSIEIVSHNKEECRKYKTIGPMLVMRVHSGQLASLK